MSDQFVLSDPNGAEIFENAAVLDTFSTGLPVCFEILLYLSSRLARIPAGQALEFITDDPEADDKIPAWCDSRNYTLLDVQTLPDRRQRFLIQK